MTGLAFVNWPRPTQEAERGLLFHEAEEPGRRAGLFVVGEIYVACTLQSATLNPGSHEPISLLSGGFGRRFLLRAVLGRARQHPINVALSLSF